jgi:H+-translocating diphosphatase
MIAPGLLVIGAPFVAGVFFGVQAVSGLLAGAIVSGVQIAISFSNTGGAWDNAKKYIEAGTNESRNKIEGGEDDNGKYVFRKGTEAHRAAVVGDTVGDPLKDTSGPSINILIKLSAITSLVFGKFFVQSGGILISQ